MWSFYLFSKATIKEDSVHLNKGHDHNFLKSLHDTAVTFLCYLCITITMGGMSVTSHRRKRCKYQEYQMFQNCHWMLQMSILLDLVDVHFHQFPLIESDFIIIQSVGMERLTYPPTGSRVLICFCVVNRRSNY